VNVWLLLLTLQLEVSSDVTKPMFERASQWRCVPFRAQVCNSDGCRQTAPSIRIQLDFKARTYGRCDSKGCDTRAATVSAAGVFTSVTLSGGTFLKALNDGAEFIDVASSSTSAFINTGVCKPAPTTPVRQVPMVKESKPVAAFEDYKTFRCAFQVGTAQSLTTNGRGEVQTDAKGFESELVFDSIDRKTGKARMIGNVGSADLVVLGSADTLSLVEITPGGNLMVTAIFSELRRSDRFTDVFQAVHSRSMVLGPEATASQFVGECRGLLP